MGRTIEQFEVGQTFETRGRTVGEADISQFAGLVGDFTPIHMDEHFAKQQGWPGRIAHGPLAMSIAIGLFAQAGVLDEGVIGMLGLDWKFAKPVMIGDTIYSRVTVLEKRMTRSPGRGIVKFGFAVVTHDKRTIQEGTMTVMMRSASAS
jgi:acyl dehydratase